MNKLIVICCMVFLYSILAGVSTAGSLIDNSNGTVTDSGTHLMWQQGESNLMLWADALMYCQGLSLANYEDWRLPNHKELLSIIDETRYNPFINTTMFPNATSAVYWSSTLYPGGWPNYVYAVNFGSGASNLGLIMTQVPYYAYPNYARCVRGGQ